MRKPHTYRFTPQIPVIAALVALCIYTLTRLGLTIFTGFDGTVFKGFEAVPLALWPEIFVKGFWFDMCVISVLLAPICLYEALLPNKWRDKSWHRVLRMVWFWLAIALLLFGAVAESTFWLEFSTRFNFIALDYLIYTSEVIGNIRESYPVGWILTGIGAVAALVLMFIWSAIRRADAQGVTWLQRAALALFALVVPATLMYYGNIDQMEQPMLPALSSNVNTKNAYTAELSGNGLFTIAAAQRRNELDYDKFYRTISQQQANTALADLGVKRKPLGDDMQAKPVSTTQSSATPFSSKPKNVIMISVESLSASYMDSYRADNERIGLTPELDKLAKNGMKFERLFATGTRTVRGLEALSLGTPPIPGQAIVRRPGNEHLSTMGELLKPQGFATFFFYGGYGYFDNMNAYFSGNGYAISDRNNFSKENTAFATIWGVADEMLFNEAIKQLDTDSKHGVKRFMHIMTTSNHRPYTYPEGRIDIPSKTGRNGAVKYTDWAIHNFLEEAKKKPWFDDTLFVIVADHNASVAGKISLPPNKYIIPALFYAPKMLPPQKIELMSSQIDLPPTILAMLGIKTKGVFFGQNLLGDNPEPRAYLVNYQELGYLTPTPDGQRHLTLLGPKKRLENYSVNSDGDLTKVPGDKGRDDKAVALFQRVDEVFNGGKYVQH